MKYATFDANGRLSGRYDSALHSVIPAGAVELTDERFFETINTTEGYWELINGTLQHTVPPRPQLPINLVPSVITMAQAQLALYQTGRIDAVEVIINAQGRAAQIEWKTRQTVERTHPLVQLVKTELPLTESELDDLFTLGASL